MQIDKIRAVIFDCDGVLFNTLKANETYYNMVLEHMKMPLLSEEQLKTVHMFSVNDSMKYLFKGEPDLLEKAIEFKKTINYVDLLPLLTEEPYLKETLSKLKENFILGIATNRTNTMDILLEKHDLEHFFKIVVTASSVKNPKPAPDQLFMIMKELMLEKDEMVFIGDSITDSKAASSAKVPFISYKYEDAENAVHKINDLRDIYRLLA